MVSSCQQHIWFIMFERTITIDFWIQKTDSFQHEYLCHSRICIKLIRGAVKYKVSQCCRLNEYDQHQMDN